MGILRSGLGAILPAGARPRIMGVINATPDSFWEGSRHPDPQDAVAAARAMVDAGAHVLDVGAVSSRPGAPHVTVEVELDRLLPVLTAVRAAVRCPITVDTSRGDVAAAALAAGADAINDVSGLADPELGKVVVQSGVPLIVTANERLDPVKPTMPAALDGLRRLLARVKAAGIALDRVVVDPGFGFGKTPAQNLQLVAALPLLREGLGLPICIGPSRKGTISHILGRRPPEGRRNGTAALVALCAAYGADLLRVHDVAAMAEVAAVASAVGCPPRGRAGVGLRATAWRRGSPLAAAAHGTIAIHGIRVVACHGVLSAEHTQPQPFLVDLDLDVDLRVASTTDRLDSTLDYAAAAAVAAGVLRGPHRDLLERLAGEIATDLLRTFPALRGGVVSVHKPDAPLGLPFADVSVRLPFARDGGGGG